MDISEKGDGDGSLDSPLSGDASPALSGREIDLLRPFGRLRSVREGDVLFEAGDADYNFHVVLEGVVAVIDEHDHEQRTLATHGKGEFVGDLALLSGGSRSRRRW